MDHDTVKDFYNNTMPGKFGDDYEHRRWFSNKIQKAGYDLTKLAIRRHVVHNEMLAPKRIFELGPGAGTWTKMLVARFPDVAIDLVDISKEMLGRAERALSGNPLVQYIESDILEWKSHNRYDFFFSSRVLEYIADKKAFCDKIFSVLNPGGRGFLITKMPHYERERFLGRKTSELHQGQIAPVALCDALRIAGFSDVDCYPVTMSIPLLHSSRLNFLVGRLLGRYPLGPIGMFFAESYCVVFRKP